jgi:hypothetical protein
MHMEFSRKISGLKFSPSPRPPLADMFGGESFGFDYQ